MRHATAYESVHSLRCVFAGCHYDAESIEDLVDVAREMKVGLAVEIEQAAAPYASVFCALLFRGAADLVGGGFYDNESGLRWLAKMSGGTVAAPPAIVDGSLVFFALWNAPLSQQRDLQKLYQVTVDLNSLAESRAVVGEWETASSLDNMHVSNVGQPILVAGLSPAWQQILTFDCLRPGEVNRARESAWCASGKAPNVGLALHRLGAHVRTLSVLGGAAGDSIAAEFAALEASYRWVWTQSATRVCTTVLAAGVTTELVENARPITEEELAEYRAAFAEEAPHAEVLVLTGSLPAGAPAELFRDLLGQFRGRAVLDVRGPELEAALPCRPWLVKPNREELAATVRQPLTTDAELHAAMRTINQRGAEWVVVTQGSAALWASSLTELWRFTPPKVDVVNPIGCGDSIAAGIAWGAAQQLPLPDCIRLGMAAAAENARTLLPCRFEADQVRAIAQDIVGERLE